MSERVTQKANEMRYPTRHIYKLSIYTIYLDACGGDTVKLTHDQVLAIFRSLETPSIYGDTFESGCVEQAARARDKPLTIRLNDEVVGHLTYDPAINQWSGECPDHIEPNPPWNMGFRVTNASDARYESC